MNTLIKIVFSSIIIMSCCFCRKTTTLLPPEKMDESCELQYTLAKWLKIGDSVALSTCNRSLTFTFLQRTGEQRFNTELKIVDLGPNEDSTLWIDEHWKYSVLLFRFKIEAFTDNSILLRLWHNYAPY